MPLVVFLRGVNVGGHRTFRPTQLARQLERFGTASIGTAGTFVIQRRVAFARLRREFARHLPFAASITICQGREVLHLLAENHFPRRSADPRTVRFVSVLAHRPRHAHAAPARIPARGRWMVKVLAHRGRFLVGVHRREMKVIRHLGELDQLAGGPVTTRSWSTFIALGKALAS